MARNIQLLKQIRAVTTAINQTSDNPEHKALLSVADILLNELMLQDAPAFYLDLLQRGKALVTEGAALAGKAGKKPDALLEIRGDLHADLRIEALEVEIEAIFDSLLAIVKVLDEGRSAEEKDYLRRVSVWESSLYNHSLEQVPLNAAEQASPITQAALQAYLEKKFPQWKNVKVTKFVTLDGGISKKTILFETHDALNGAQSLVIRAEQPVNLLYFDGSDVALEFYMIQLMQKAGMPIAEPLWLEEDTSHFGVRFIVSRKAEGKPIGGNFGSYEPLTPGQLDSYMSNFFRMHGIRPDPADPLVKKSHLNAWMSCKTIHEATRFYAAEYMPELIRRAGIKTTPQLMRALRWLEKNVPDCDEPPVIVHLDYAFNNMIFDGDKMTALLDWETSRLGDPADDFIWTQVNLGLYSMPELVQKYKQGTGRDVSEYRIAYARLTKCLINLIAGRTGLQYINTDDNSPLHMGVMTFKFMPMLGSNVDELIAFAESVKPKAVLR